MDVKNVIRSMAVGFIGLGVGLASAATTAHVDRSRGNDEWPGTAESPFATIQKGVDAVEDGGTVFVLPGIYDVGETADSDGCLNRVCITKRLTLVAAAFEETGCRTNTVIRGRAAASPLSPSLDLGLGDDAVRCVRATVAGVVIRGFTLEGGRTRFDGGGTGADQNLGGGVFGNATAGTRVEDCIIRDCAARSGGATANCRVVRCLVTGCNAANVGVCFRASEVWNSIVARNGGLQVGAGLGAYTGRIVGSTIVENATGVWQDSGAACNNCAIFRTALGNVKDKGFNSCVTDNDWADYGHDANCRTATYESCLYSPLANDFRAVAGSDLDGKGDAAWADLSLGGATDFLGAARLSADGTAMNVGAVQETVSLAADDSTWAPSFAQPYAGATWANGARQAAFGPVVVMGGKAGSFLREKAGAAAYPSSFRLRLPSRRALGYLNATAGDGAETHSVLLNLDDSVDLPRLPRVGATDTAYGLATADALLHVDRANGSDVTGDGSAEKPYQSLQKAAAVAVTKGNGCVVYVRPGDYDNGTETPASDCGTLRCRLAVKNPDSGIRFVAVEGPAGTRILGQADGTTGGLGDDAIRCVHAYSGTGKALVLSGFTFASGHSGADAVDKDARGSVAYRGGLGALWLSDSVVTGCESANGLLYQANAVRCRFTSSLTLGGSIAAGGVIASSLAWGCGPDGNGSHYLITGETRAYNVSVGRTSEKSFMSIGEVYNSVLDNGGDSGDINGYGIENGGLHKHTLAYAVGGTPHTEAGGNQEGSVFGVRAGFADVGGGDLRLVACSLARGLARFDLMFKGCPTDAFGVAFKGSADGRFTAGAVETTVPGALFETTYRDGIEPAEPKAFDSAGEIAVASTALSRPLVGYAVNGSLVATTNRTWTLRLADYPGVDSFTVTAVYGTNFWADATNGKESNSGLYETEPKRCINSALDLTEPGDVVIALPGRYESEAEARLHADGAKVRSRVVVPRKRTVRSRDGAETTFIVGAAATSPKALGRLGADAVRGVFLNEDAAVEGFTITGGSTDSPESGWADLPNDDGRGGGVCGSSANTSVVRDCVIADNAAVRGGGVCRVTCRRCRIVGNVGTHLGTGANLARLVRTFADGNAGSLAWLYQGWLDGCTVGADNRQPDTALPAEAHLDNKNALIRNTIVLGGRVTCVSSNVHDCVFAPGVEVAGLPAGDHRCLLGADATPLAFEADGVTPKIGENVAIDRGNPESVPAEDRDRDLAGHCQIWNGMMDVGAVEADWRDRYAKALSGNRLKVDAAPATAVEDAARMIRLLSGALEMSWRPRANAPTPMRLNYSVAGTGTLMIRLNGEVVDTATAGQTRQYAYLSPSLGDSLTFTYEPGEDDALGALIGRFDNMVGMVLTVR